MVPGIEAKKMPGVSILPISLHFMWNLDFFFIVWARQEQEFADVH